MARSRAMDEWTDNKLEQARQAAVAADATLAQPTPDDADGQQALIDALKQHHKVVKRLRRDLEVPPVAPALIEELANGIELDIDAGTSPEVRSAEEAVVSTAAKVGDAHIAMLVTSQRLRSVASRGGEDFAALVAGLDSLEAERVDLLAAHRQLLPEVL